jgi:hypothetical protein
VQIERRLIVLEAVLACNEGDLDVGRCWNVGKRFAARQTGEKEKKNPQEAEIVLLV